MNLRNYILQRSMGGGREVYRSSSSNISNIFVPIQPRNQPEERRENEPK